MLRKNLKNVLIDNKLLLTCSILIACLFFFYSSAVFEYSHTPKIIGLLLLALPIGLFFKPSIKSKPSLILIIAYVLFIGVFLVGIFRSYNPGNATYKFFPMAIAFILVWLLFNRFKSPQAFIKTISIPISIACAILCSITIFPILCSINNGHYSHQLTYTFIHSFGHRNIFSSALLLSFPLLLAGTVLSSIRWIKAMHIITLNLIAATIILLMTRSSIIALVLMLCIVGLYYFLKSANRKMKFRMLIIALVLGSSYLGTVLVLKNTSSDFSTVLRDFTALTHGSGQERQEIWSKTWALHEQNSILGAGTDNWRVDILQVKFDHARNVNDNVYFQRVHNDYIQILYENGWAGLLSYLSMVVLSILSVIKSPHFSGQLKSIFIAGIFGFMIIAFFSFPMERVELLFLLFCMVIPSFQRAKYESKSYKVIVVLPILLLVFSLSRITQERNMLDAKKQELDGNIAESENVLGTINTSIYAIDHTGTPIEWHKGNIKFKQGDFHTALLHFKKAEGHNPFHPHVLSNIAACYFQKGAIVQSEKYYRKVLKIQPQFSEAILNYSALLFNNNRISESLAIILTTPIGYEPNNFNNFYLTIVKGYILRLTESNENYATWQMIKDDDNQLLKIGKNCRLENTTLEEQLISSSLKCHF